MLTTLLPFSLALVASLIVVPAIIKVAYHKRLVDDPRLEDRKIHRYSVPNLGGVAVFSIFALVSCLFTSSNSLQQGNFIFAAGIIIFSIGLKDDLVSLDPYKKFLAQFITAFITVYLADIRFTSFYGVLGMEEITPILSYLFTSVAMVFIINAFNLIDGINGLLGGITLLISLTYGTLFYFMNEQGLSVLSFSLAGAVLGFLKYNVGRARIFMGDAGAYSIGFVIALLSIKFIELNKDAALGGDSFHFIKSAPAIALAILIIPTYDTLRVFTKRIIDGKSPFFADRNHIHHRLLNVGFTHSQASAILVATNLVFIALALGLDQIGTTQLMLVVILTAQFISAMFWLYDAKRNLIATNKAKDALLPAEEPSDISLNTAAIPIKKVVSKEIKEELLERLEDQKS
ncbi:glycosyltransferase family 4 protein [Olivibacter domesticus]|uniref:UDP-N-acetylmuramyl pentapeptide phosphotransferase/UDP-N-acetylglucosamine-1-phosphate transferase n=1 Tax=Olivibacter domesticus TaxID=407022 RepID=A0A1H7V0L7_OLID1|nr:MraY family glycosyltransferase [Olivibacter domesticus]SEM02700.1 UDP-N-acetylmuramyl pentapeptide phosphotransferase/UDP-N-acetylglucosamine-1-phosphate transferase [Olivibacter domesticus]